MRLVPSEDRLSLPPSPESERWLVLGRHSLVSHTRVSEKKTTTSNTGLETCVYMDILILLR